MKYADRYKALCMALPGFEEDHRHVIDQLVEYDRQILAAYEP